MQILTVVELVTFLKNVNKNFTNIKIVLARYMNINVLPENYTYTESYLNFVFSQIYMLKAMRPTRVTSNSAKQSDHIVGNDISMVVSL